MSFTATKSYSNGSALTKAQLDALWDSIETYFNTTKVATAELADSSVDTAQLDNISIATAKIDSTAVTWAKVAASLKARLVLTGSITAFASESTPTGFLYCDGSAVSRTTYADLFGIIGTQFGEGDASTTFNVPDLRGRFLRGLDDGAGRDTEAASRTAMGTGGNTGDNIGSIQAALTALPTGGFSTDSQGGHTHTFDSTPSITSGSSPYVIQPGVTTDTTDSGTTDSGGSHTHTFSGGDNETRPINANVVYYIKT